MPQTFSPADAVGLAVVERNGFVESRHIGSAVVIDPAGNVVRSLGNPGALVLPRSALKPLQALGCLTAGAELEGSQLGLATASHSGTERHVAVVRGMLGAADLTEDDLACPEAWPEDSATRDELVRELARPTRIRMTCSGKHAAMLRACRASGWETAGYLDPAHPLQAHILQLVERLTGQRPATIAIDGCGAPVPALSLTGLAQALHRLGTASERSPFALHRLGATLLRAVRDEPWTVAGPGRPDTVVAEHTGAFSKFGAEGVQTMVAPDGTTVALKILDGSPRAAVAVALRLLELAGGLSRDVVERALAELPLTVRGGGTVVGGVRVLV